MWQVVHLRQMCHPATTKLPVRVSAKLSGDVKLKVKSSMFDVVSPQPKGRGSKGGGGNTPAVPGITCML